MLAAPGGGRRGAPTCGRAGAAGTGRLVLYLPRSPAGRGGSGRYAHSPLPAGGQPPSPARPETRTPLRAPAAVSTAARRGAERFFPAFFPSFSRGFACPPCLRPPRVAIRGGAGRGEGDDAVRRSRPPGKFWGTGGDTPGKGVPGGKCPGGCGSRPAQPRLVRYAFFPGSGEKKKNNKKRKKPYSRRVNK